MCVFYEWVWCEDGGVCVGVRITRGEFWARFSGVGSFAFDYK